MLKIILALISCVLIFRAADMKDVLLAFYWFMVWLYWLINYVEGKRK